MLRLVTRIAIAGIFSTIACFSYTALYPNKEFYIGEFKKLSGVELSSDVEFLYKDTTYPFHGYSSCFVFVVSNPVIREALNSKASKNDMSSYWCHDSGIYEIQKSGAIVLKGKFETGYWGITKEGYVIASYGTST